MVAPIVKGFVGSSTVFAAIYVSAVALQAAFPLTGYNGVAEYFLGLFTVAVGVPLGIASVRDLRATRASKR